MNRATAAAQILATARNLRTKISGVDELANRALIEDWTPEQFRTAALERLGVKPLQRPSVDLDPKAWEKYSIIRAINCTPVLGGKWDGLEGEVSRELQHQTGQQPCGGIFIPPEVLWGRNYEVGTGVGAELVGQSNYSFSDGFRAKAVCGKLGAEVVQLNNPVSVPVLAEAGTGNWVAGSVASTLSVGNFVSVSLVPHALTCHQQYEKQILFSSNPGIDRVVRGDIAGIISAQVDRVALSGGGGGSSEPLGVLGTSGVNTVCAATNGLALEGSTLALPFLCSLEEQIALDNADSSLGWVMAAQDRASLRATTKFANGGDPIWSDDNKVLGYDAAVSTQLSRNLSTGTATTVTGFVILCNFRDLLIANFGPVELVVDQYSAGESGILKIYSRTYWDTALRRPKSAALGGGILAT